ncbi:CBS domain-containing protein [Teredinibacter purpureus]|jgi:Predicted transcriptional regulator, contains C-terminal CBS domains|uniref:CBS domain-containing protein n=1 Tax=Teredinibacter purpureus TaxID=2731756 RepID=UPI0005F83369|nr:CBS domain-containing protein [Teredinibacter purpureus]
MTRKVITCRDVMNQRFAIVDGLTTVSEALNIMNDNDYKKVVIKKRDESDEWGQVLLSDIAKHVIAKDRSPERVNCYEIMAKPVIAVRPGMDIKYCARLFNSFGLSSAPVIENQDVIGVVSYNDIVLSWLDYLESR